MHPFVKILCFITLLLLINFLSNQMIWLLCILVSALAANLQFNKFIQVVKRMRWFFISIFIIYAFGTPGEYVRFFSSQYAPTIEGCVLGLLQITKLLIALAGLSILFARSSKEHLMVGLHLMLSPLKLFGVNIERFTARLLLTLDYVEELAVKGNFRFHQLDEIHATATSLDVKKVIIFREQPFSLTDKLLIVTVMFGVLALLTFKLLP